MPNKDQNFFNLMPHWLYSKASNFQDERGKPLRIFTAEVSEARFEKAREGFVGVVALRAHDKHLGIAYFECFATLPADAGWHNVNRTLIEDARRQLARMPEYKRGKQHFKLRVTTPDPALA